MDRYRHQRPLLGTISEQLKKSHMGIVGVGALGSLCAQMLIRCGIGTITLIDPDIVEEHNLHRQYYFESEIGQLKVEATAQQLRQINNKAIIIPKADFVYDENCESLLADCEIVLGCTDTMQSKMLLNDFALKHTLPYVFGSAQGLKGNAYTILKNKPCLQCFIKGHSALTCDDGILNTTTSLISAHMVNMVLRVLCNDPLDSWISIDSWETSIIKVSPGTVSCPACRGEYLYLEGKKKVQEPCGEGIFSFRRKIDLHSLAQTKLGMITHNNLSFFGPFTLFSDGRILVKAKTRKEASVLLSRFLG